ncbi:MAG: aquaporin [Chloroflexi bacterium]|nr:MAG: aquaporin [Chloroflexota bacterium]
MEPTVDFSTNYKAYLAELIGTFALTFIGGGSIAAGDANSLTGIALAHGLAIMTMIYALGHISGIHINPAVTVSLLVGGKIRLGNALAYIIPQLIGAILAGFALLFVYNTASPANDFLGTPRLGPNVGVLTGIIVEIILTFFLTLTVWGAAVDGRTAGPAVGLAIGMVVAMDILMGGPITGAAMNPARALGPAIASGHLDNWYVYWVGPILGGVIAGLLYPGLFLRKI